MSKLKWFTEKITKHKKLVIFGVIVLVTSVAGIIVVKDMNQKKEEMLARMNQPQTSVIERRTLVSSVSATGTFTSVDSKDISVNLNGMEIKSISVEVGDEVEAGQVLCVLDSKDIEEDLADARQALHIANEKTKMDITAAERNLEEAMDDYTKDVDRGNKDLALAYDKYLEALADVEEAKREWDKSVNETKNNKLSYDYYKKLLDENEENLEESGKSAEIIKKFNAKKSEMEQYAEINDIDFYNKVLSSISLGNDFSKTTAEMLINTEKNTTKTPPSEEGGEDTPRNGNGQNNGDKGTDNGESTQYQELSKTEEIRQTEENKFKSDLVKDDEISEEEKKKIDQYLSELKKINSSYNAVLKSEDKYQELEKEVSKWETEHKSSEQEESSAKKAYEQAVSAAESQLEAYEKQQRSFDDTFKSGETSILSKNESLYSTHLNALTSGDSEEEKIEDYLEQLEECTVKAPMSGVISAVNMEAGDIYNGSAIVTIDDISAFEITAQIDEYDIGKIQKGQKVVIKTNATGEEELDGTVKRISPRATSGGSEVTYTVTISVDTPHEMLRMDMSAKLSIILESKENVLTVPYEAVQEEADGRFYVEVVTKQEEEQKNQGKNSSPKTDEVDKENTPVIPEGTDKEKMPVMPEGMDKEGMSVMPEGMGKEGMTAIPEGMGGRSRGNSQKVPTSVNGENTQIATKKIYVEKGIESDYYIEIISSEIVEGMEILVPSSERESGGRDIQSMMMRQGPMGGF